MCGVGTLETSSCGHSWHAFCRKVFTTWEVHLASFAKLLIPSPPKPHENSTRQGFHLFSSRTSEFTNACEHIYIYIYIVLLIYSFSYLFTYIMHVLEAGWGPAQGILPFLPGHEEILSRRSECDASTSVHPEQIWTFRMLQDASGWNWERLHCPKDA